MFFQTLVTGVYNYKIFLECNYDLSMNITRAHTQYLNFQEFIYGYTSIKAKQCTCTRIIITAFPVDKKQHKCPEVMGYTYNGILSSCIKELGSSL